MGANYHRDTRLLYFIVGTFREKKNVEKESMKEKGGQKPNGDSHSQEAEHPG